MREDADCVGVFGSVRAGGGADDVVCEHAGHVYAGVLVGLGEEVGTVKVLLLAGYGDEDERAFRFSGGHYAGEFQGDGDTGGVVVGARGKGGVVIWVCAAAVVVA